MFRDRTGLVGGPLCGFLRHFAACYTVIQPVIHPCLGLSLKEWKDAGRERTMALFSKKNSRFCLYPVSSGFFVSEDLPESTLSASPRESRCDI